MPPSLWEVLSTVPGAIVIVLALMAGACLVVWALVRGAEDDACDCPKKIIRRQDPANGWAILTIHNELCPRKELP